MERNDKIKNLPLSHSERTVVHDAFPLPIPHIKKIETFLSCGYQCMHFFSDKETKKEINKFNNKLSRGLTIVVLW